MMMQLEPGMRVRCVRHYGASGRLSQGAEYVVSKRDGEYVALEGGTALPGWHYTRFKPIVRVKMGRS